LAVEKKFVQEGFKKAMIDEFFLEKLERAGYGGMDINRTPMGTQITIRAEKPGMIIGKAGKSIRRYTKDLDMRFKMDNPQIDVQEVKKPELNAQMMASRLANALERGWYFRKAGQSTLQRIMDAGAMGVEIVIAGKLTGPRKRTEKFVAGYIKHCGKPVEELVDVGYARAKKKLGIIGVKVRIMPPAAVLPDKIAIAPPQAAQVGASVPREMSSAVGTEPESPQAAAVPVQTETTAQEVEKIIADSHAAEAAAPRAAGEKPARPRQQRARRPPRKEGEPKAAEHRPAAPNAEAPAAAPAATEAKPEEPKASEPKAEEPRTGATEPKREE
jgi:small subunit ribosomal protein S3